MENRLRIGYVALGGAVAWFLHLMIVYALGEGLCVLRRSDGGFSLNTIGIIILAVSVGLFAVAVGAIVMAFKLRRAVARGEQLLPGEGVGFVINSGLVSDALFALVILAQTAPLLMLRETC